MKIILIAFLSAFLISCTGNKANKIPAVSAGKIIRIENFKSEYVAARNIDIWLPGNYDPDKKYSVLYMNDGQMLFDSTITWNRQEWQVDEVLSALIRKGRIKDCIVVGIFNNNEYRYAEYFPVVALNGMQEPDRGSIISSILMGKALSDNYLNFIAGELKPFVDKNYSTYTDPDNTYIIGSDMGGLISFYALCRYPDIFGGAGCLSTHWPMFSPRMLLNKKYTDNASDAFIKYLSTSLSQLRGKKIYFDYGSETLDRFYKPYQQRVDNEMYRNGFTSKEWITIEFPGEEHSEASWGKRLNIPVEFLLVK